MKGINTITANFSNGGRQCITRKLFQYDYGQKVLIKGLTLPQSFEFHISNSNSPKASSNIFLGNNNEIIIPDEYLTSGEDIYIWIFLHQTTSDGQTRYTINIPIQKRPKAESKEPTQVEQNVIDQLISSLEQKVDEISAATEQAKDTFLKYPEIINNYWHAYNLQTKSWVNTGVKALGEDGVGIRDIFFNNDYTLTITFTDDSVFTTASIRGEKGQKGDTGVTPHFNISPTQTLPAGNSATVSISGTDENPILNFKIPRGDKGEKGDVGNMPNITIGTVNSLAPGSTPYVLKTGTKENPTLVFGLVKGDKGDQGIQGIQGPKGDQGDAGKQGPQGIQGQTGATGPQGQKGDKGDQGIQGVQGPKGDTGETGPAGPKGDTPQKGVDYWTATDKEQIIEDVLASQDITDLKDQIDSKEDTLNYSNPVQGFALTAKTIENGKVTEWDFGEAGGLKIHICSSSEYSSESRIPIISEPDEKTIYLVPASYQPSNNMFTEWVYINNTWEIFGSVAVDLSNYLTDVQTNGTSIINNGVANIPVMSENNYGVAKILNDTDYGIKLNKIGNVSDVLTTSPASASQIKRGAASYNPIAPINEHYAVFYGLANAAGQNERNSELPLGQYTDEAKTAIQTMLDVPSNDDVVNDVQVNGTSIVSNGVANVPVAGSSTVGVVKTEASQGLVVNNSGLLTISQASQNYIKSGTRSNNPITPIRQHEAVFYGLAKAAGHDEKNSTLPVGTYSNEAKTAIQNMLNVPSKAAATTTANGLMSAQDKTKLNNLMPTLQLLPTQTGSSTPEGWPIVQFDHGIRQVALHMIKGGVVTVNTVDDFIYPYYGMASLLYTTGIVFGYSLIYEQNAILSGYFFPASTGAEDNYIGVKIQLITPISDMISNATQESKGLMSAEDKTKLDTTYTNCTNLQTSKADKSYVDEAISQIPTGSVDDVQIDGTSVVTDGVAVIPVANGNGVKGLMYVASNSGLRVLSTGQIAIKRSDDSSLKLGENLTNPITCGQQHISAFYGFAKAAGYDEKNSALSIGTYSEGAKSAISNMLNGAIIVEGTTPTIIALSGVRYVCGEVATLDFTPCATGICDVVFTSGSTPTVVTLPNTVKFPDGAFTAEANKTYEINILDGVYGVVMSWT